MNARYRQAGWVIIGILLGIVVTQTVIATQRTDETVTLIRQAQASNTELLRTVKSCTTPGRVCYERAQHQTAHAVASINQITILAAACAAQGLRTAPRIQTCVLRGLDEK
jgi:hypothetical protein